jgi:hypothetical protein
LSISYHAVAKEFNASKALDLPIDDKQYAKWLGDEETPTALIQATDPAIRDQARKIIGDETNSYKAACKLRAWVYANMKGGLAFSPISAVQILKSLTGDCKHYATLYVALARSVGIPSRTVVGLMLIDSTFYTHEWAEIFVGEWVPIDATLDQNFVDAAHVPADMLDALRIIDAAARGEITECAYLSNLKGDPAVPENCRKITCSHGVTFFIPQEYDPDIAQCSVHVAVPPEWTKMIWSDGRVFFYPTRVPYPVTSGTPQIPASNTKTTIININTYIGFDKLASGTPQTPTDNINTTVINLNTYVAVYSQGTTVSAGEDGNSVTITQPGKQPETLTIPQWHNWSKNILPGGAVEVMIAPTPTAVKDAIASLGQPAAAPSPSTNTSSP